MRKLKNTSYETKYINNYWRTIILSLPVFDKEFKHALFYVQRGFRKGVYNIFIFYTKENSEWVGKAFLSREAGFDRYRDTKRK